MLLIVIIICFLNFFILLTYQFHLLMQKQMLTNRIHKAQMNLYFCHNKKMLSSSIHTLFPPFTWPVLRLNGWAFYSTTVRIRRAFLLTVIAIVYWHTRRRIVIIPLRTTIQILSVTICVVIGVILVINNF